MLTEFSKPVEFIERLLVIADKQSKTVPFVLKPAQQFLLDHATLRNIVLKGRQLGMSALIDALFLIDCLTLENQYCVVISQDKESTRRLFDRVKFYLDNIKTKQKPITKYNNRGEISFPGNNSTFYVGTAGDRSFGRGDMITRLHVSELPFWKNPQALGGLMEAVPEKGIVWIESTANGVGNILHQLWKDAKQGKNCWNPIFISWLLDKDYEADPPHDAAAKWTEEEMIVLREFKLSERQMAWMRLKIASMIDRALFPQEYPLSDTQAFLTTGRTVFQRQRLDALDAKTVKPVAVGRLIRMADRLIFEQDDNGWLEIYRWPDDDCAYVAGCDTAKGVGGDNSCAWVIEAAGRNQVAEVCIDCPPDIFGERLHMLGEYYNWAELVVEENNHGLVTLIKLRDMHYPRLYCDKPDNLGWTTDKRSKIQMVEALVSAVRDGRIGVASAGTIAEMRTYQPDGVGYAAASGCKDDRVVACAMAYYVASCMKNIKPAWAANNASAVASRTGASYPPLPTTRTGY